MSNVDSTETNVWKGDFARECERLLEALGPLTDGGIVEHLEHVGATSVPDLFGQPCLDIALAVWPFPLEQPAQDALISLGYMHDPGVVGDSEQRFQHASAAIRLYVVESGSPAWMDFLVIREHLRHDASARKALSACKGEEDVTSNPSGYHAAKGQWLNSHLNEARRSWIGREGFAPVNRAAEELREFPAGWHISGGWALDLFLGRVTRIHDDVDVAVDRADQATLHQYLTSRGWTLLTDIDGRLRPWPVHMRLDPPRHQVHAFRRGVYIDFLLSDVEGSVWRYRRDPTLIREVGRMGMRSDADIPHLAPELVLLFKSTRDTGTPRAKDRADFAHACKRLDAERHAWLRWALTATNPAHSWLALL